MASSGVTVSEESKDAFNEWKKSEQGKGKIIKKCPFLVFKIAGTKVIQDDKAPQGVEDTLADLSQYMKSLLDDKANKEKNRFSVCKVRKGHQEEVISIKWVFDESSIKDRMLYASTADAFKVGLQTGKIMQISELADFCEDELIAQVKDIK